MGAGNEKVAYWRGKHSTIPSDIISGRLLFEQDTGDVFFDYKDYDNGELKRVQITDTTKMNISGGTFTGDVILVGDPKEPLGAVTKQYADKIQDNLDSHTSNEEIHITQQERQSWNNKVDKVDGKQLSTNDFTDELKSKLDGISEEATKVEISLQNNPSESEKVDFINLGYISINDVEYQIYMPAIKDITGNAETASRLKTPRLIDGVEFDGTSNVIHYGLCQTAGATDIKDVTINNFKLQSGSIAYIYFRYQNKSTSAQLNISETGSYPIYYLGSPILADQLNIGLYEFVFIDGSNKRYEMVASVDTKYGQATETQPGLLTPEDKQKLDSIEYGANNYVLPISTQTTLGGVKIGNNITSETDGTISINQQNIISALGYQPLASDAIDGDILYQMLEEMVGATSTSNGQGGLVPTPFIGDQDSYLCGDGKWKSPDNVVSSIPLDRVNEILKDSLGSSGGGGEIVGPDNPSATPYAIYSEDDNSLNFYQRTYIPQVGEVFNGKTASIIYDSIDHDNETINRPNRPWSNICSTIQSVDIVDKIHISDFKCMFDGFSQLSEIDLSNFVIPEDKKITLGYMFCECTNLTSIDLSRLCPYGAYLVGYNESIFYNSGLQTILGFELLDTSNCISVGTMFRLCRNLTYVNLSNFVITDNYTDNRGFTNNNHSIFTSCNKLQYIELKFDISNLSTDSTKSNAVWFADMFSGCVNASSIKISGNFVVYNSDNCFSNCINLKTIYSSSWNFLSNLGTSSSRNNTIFTGCTSLVGGNGTKFDTNNIGYQYAKVDSLNSPGYFTEIM